MQWPFPRYSFCSRWRWAGLIVPFVVVIPYPAKAFCAPPSGSLSQEVTGQQIARDADLIFLGSVLERVNYTRRSPEVISVKEWLKGSGGETITLWFPKKSGHISPEYSPGSGVPVGRSSLFVLRRMPDFTTSHYAVFECDAVALINAPIQKSIISHLKKIDRR